MISRYGSGPLKPDDLEEGLLVIEEHTKSIVDATFSPEGSALATVSLDGTIKFFQVSSKFFFFNKNFFRPKQKNLMKFLFFF